MRPPPTLFSRILADQPAVPEADRFDPPLRADERVRRVAVLVAHGMGQQVRYETLAAMVDVVRRGQRLATGFQAPVGAYLVPWQDDYLARAELHFRRKDGRPHEVHVYEAYWAPLTVGRISTLETFLFLLSAGWNGQRRLREGFWRYMFGQWNALKITPPTRASLLGLSLMLALLAAMNAVVLAVATTRVISGGAARWMSPPLLRDLTIDFALFELLAGGLGFLGIWIPSALRSAGVRRAQQADEAATQAARAHGGPAPAHTPAAVPLWVSVTGMVLVGVALLATAVAGFGVCVHVAGRAFGRWWMTWEGTGLSNWFLALAASKLHWVKWTLLVLAALVWAAVLGLSWFVRYFLREFVGDVAIYVSSNALNRFAETRSAIQKVVGQVAHCVYSQKAEGPSGARREDLPPLYDRVVIVGHSLGSVVAYDVLNEMLRDEIYDHQSDLVVRERTRALITFGSPLDKTAFIFRQQTPNDLEMREALAATWQPLIRKYLYRPPRWINLYSEMDWISGQLRYYDKSHDAETEAASRESEIARDPGRDDDPGLEEERRVRRVRDPGASTPLAAHNEYWDGDALASTVFEEITCDDPPPAR